VTVILPPTKRDGSSVRERFLAYGPPGSAKTTGLLRIAKWYQDTETPGTFYVISTDLAYEAMLMDPEYESLENLVVYDVDPSNMQEFEDAGKEIKQKGRLTDWFSVDLVGDAWKASQDEYANISTKGKIGDVGSLWRSSGSITDYPISGWEWGMPNARYRYLLNNCVRSFRGHVYCVSGQKELLQTSGSGKTKENELVKQTFNHIGMKPDTKADEEAYRFHTIMHFSGGRYGKFKLATAKEKFKYRRLMGKEMSNGSWSGEEYEDLFMDYFVKVAQWKLA
jgi:hypothetical protein